MRVRKWELFWPKDGGKEEEFNIKILVCETNQIDGNKDEGGGFGFESERKLFLVPRTKEVGPITTEAILVSCLVRVLTC